jgi:nicotinamidase-related amidase
MADDLIAQNRPFFDWLAKWCDELPESALRELLEQASGPQRTAVFCEDLVNGFCHEGPLSGPRVKAIITPIVTLLEQAHQAGVRDFVLPQDSHPPDSPEFSSYGPHCVAGSKEAETVPELLALPFASLFRVIPKRSLNPGLEPELERWLEQHPDLSLAIVVGDCTDLCDYQLAMHLKLRSNALGQRLRVLVPADCVDTYDLPVEAARQLGTLPHPGELLHRLFLYHLRLNGVEVVRAIL